MEASLFDSFNARFLQPAQIARRFVVPAHFDLVCERNHSVIVGPRGSGKTTLLKMLQMDALRNLPLESKSRVLNQIDFTAIYVAADSSWSSLFSDNEDFVVPENFKHLIAFAIFNVYLNFAILDTLEELADEALNDDPSLIRFFIPRSTTEGRLAPALASVWMLDGVTPTYFILRAKLSERLNDIAIISNKVKFGAFSSEKDCILSHPFFVLTVRILAQEHYRRD